MILAIQATFTTTGPAYVRATSRHHQLYKILFEPNDIIDQAVKLFRGIGWQTGVTLSGGSDRLFPCCLIAHVDFLVYKTDIYYVLATQDTCVDEINSNNDSETDFNVQIIG
jgi:hypothetical protein